MSHLNADQGRSILDATVARTNRRRRASAELVADIKLLIELIGDGRSCPEAIADLSAARGGLSPNRVWSSAGSLEGFASAAGRPAGLPSLNRRPSQARRA
jgi:hypothetical protein